MLSTREVVYLLRAENPGASITEERVRYAIRRGDVHRPGLFAGLLAWSPTDVARLAAALGLNVPHLSADDAGGAR